MTADHAKVKPELEFLTQLDTGPDRKTVLNCMQCGMCSGSCPLGDVMEYPPRQMILNARSGYLDDVLKSASLWMCIGCYTCSYRCPRAIELTDGLWPAMISLTSGVALLMIGRTFRANQVIALAFGK